MAFNKKITKKGAIVIDGHVQGLAITRSLGENGIPIIVIDKNNCIARYSKFCIQYFKCPEYLSPEFIPFLTSLAQEHNLIGWTLFPCNDHIVLKISKNLKKLKKIYKIITPSYEIINNIYNKKELLNIAENIGLKIPKTYYPKDFDLTNFDIKFPVIIKGIESLNFYKKMKKKRIFINNLDELKKNLVQISKRIPLEKTKIQEIINNNRNHNIVSFTSFSLNGKIKSFWIGEKIREHPTKFGTGTYCKSIIEPTLYHRSQILLEKLNYTGVSEIEYIKDKIDNEYKIIEINPRTWLWISLAKRCGIDYPLMIYNYLNNIENNYKKKYSSNVCWIHLWTDLLFSLLEIIKFRLNIFHYLKTLIKVNDFAVFSIKDIKPFIVESLLLLYLAKKR